MPCRVTQSLSSLSSLSSLFPILLALHAPAHAQSRTQTAAMAPDIPLTKFEALMPGADYVKQVVMIPMRDGVKLYTVIVVPQGATRAPPDAGSRTRDHAAAAAANADIDAAVDPE